MATTYIVESGRNLGAIRLAFQPKFLLFVRQMDLILIYSIFYVKQMSLAHVINILLSKQARPIELMGRSSKRFRTFVLYPAWAPHPKFGPC